MGGDQCATAGSALRWACVCHWGVGIGPAETVGCLSTHPLFVALLTSTMPATVDDFNVAFAAYEALEGLFKTLQPWFHLSKSCRDLIR